MNASWRFQHVRSWWGGNNILERIDNTWSHESTESCDALRGLSMYSCCRIRSTDIPSIDNSVSSISKGELLRIRGMWTRSPASCRSQVDAAPIVGVLLFPIPEEWRLRWLWLLLLLLRACVFRTSSLDLLGNTLFLEIMGFTSTFTHFELNFPCQPGLKQACSFKSSCNRAWAWFLPPKLQTSVVVVASNAWWSSNSSKNWSSVACSLITRNAVSSAVLLSKGKDLLPMLRALAGMMSLLGGLGFKFPLLLLVGESSVSAIAARLFECRSAHSFITSLMSWENGNGLLFALNNLLLPPSKNVSLEVVSQSSGLNPPLLLLCLSLSSFGGAASASLLPLLVTTPFTCNCFLMLAMEATTAMAASALDEDERGAAAAAAEMELEFIAMSSGSWVAEAPESSSGAEEVTGISSALPGWKFSPRHNQVSLSSKQVEHTPLLLLLMLLLPVGCEPPPGCLLHPRMSACSSQTLRNAKLRVPCYAICFSNAILASPCGRCKTLSSIMPHFGDLRSHSTP